MATIRALRIKSCANLHITHAISTITDTAATQGTEVTVKKLNVHRIFS